MMNKSLQPTFKLLLLSLFTLLIVSSCKDEERELENSDASLDSLSQELERYKHQADSLQLLIENGDEAAEYPVYFGRAFDSIDNPKAFVENSLREKPDLIPLEPVVGGTMAFRQVNVLTENWVLGIYDDGHIEGKSIYSYELQPNGELKFTHITSRHPEE
ncbi:hypothetical protein [Salinimicrobium flavum]